MVLSHWFKVTYRIKCGKSYNERMIRSVQWILFWPARYWQQLRLTVLCVLRSHIDEINELISALKHSRTEVSETVTIVYISNSLPQVSKLLRLL